MSDGKGRPTPKRSDAQKRRTGPVPPAPANRKEAAKRLREQQASGRTGSRAGAGRPGGGMLARDAGPIRGKVRDIVDSRRNLGVLLLPGGLIAILGQVSGSRQLYISALALWLAILGAVVLDSIGTGLRIRKELAAAFPQEQKLSSHITYGLARSTRIRRLRQPRPTVGRGSLF